MKKILLSIIILTALSSCAQTSNGVSSGLIFTSWKDRDPITRVDNSISAAKQGEGCVTNILGLFAFGDSSIDTAKQEGNVRNISYVDRTYSSFGLIYIPIFQRGCTVVRGS